MTTEQEVKELLSFARQCAQDHETLFAPRDRRQTAALINALVQLVESLGDKSIARTGEPLGERDSVDAEKLIDELSAYSHEGRCEVCYGAGCVGIPGAVCQFCDGAGKNRLALAFKWIALEKVANAAREYRSLWLICHENNPREPETGDLIKLGHLRGALFAAIDAAMGAAPITREIVERSGERRNAGRCESIGPHPHRFRCGLRAGHDEGHTALIPTGSPWSVGDNYYDVERRKNIGDRRQAGS